MKRQLWILISLAAMVCFSWVGCTDDDSPNDSTGLGPNPKGRLYVLNQTEGTIYVFDTETLERTDSIDAMISNPHYIDFSPDGRFFFVTTLEGPGKIAKFDATNNTFISTVTMTGQVIPSAIAIVNDSSNNMFGYVCDFTLSPLVTGNVHKYNLDDMSFVTSSIRSGATSHDMKVTSDGKVIVVCSRDTDDITLVYPPSDTVIVVPIDPAEQRPAGQAVYGPFGVAIDHRDSLAYIACIKADQIRVLDITTQTIVDSIDIEHIHSDRMPHGPTLMTVAPDNDVVWVTTQWSDHVFAVRRSDKATVAEHHLSVGRCFGITMSSDGSRVYAASVNFQNQPGRVYIFDGPTYAKIDSIDVGTNSFGLIWRPL
ncbi:MAG: hypothetical protein ACE5FH_02595 [Candidatus Zixiibacteriota bacterium]